MRAEGEAEDADECGEDGEVVGEFDGLDPPEGLDEESMEEDT